MLTPYALAGSRDDTDRDSKHCPHSEEEGRLVAYVTTIGRILTPSLPLVVKQRVESGDVWGPETLRDTDSWPSMGPR